MKYLTGYVTVRRFKGYALPVPVQNRLLREYANKLNMIYVLPQCEMVTNKNYMMLFETLEEMNENSCLGMCSIFMFPEDNEKARDIMEILMKKNITSHFVFDEISVKPNEIKDYYINSNIDTILGIKNKNSIINLFE